MIIDQNIRKEVLDIYKSFLVQAPAGSGKTTLLVQRFLRLLNIVQDPEEIIAITFTRKAASEMRDRILYSLKIKDNAISKKIFIRDKKFKWNLLDNPIRLKIYTIDALCTYITRKLPIITKFGAIPKISDNIEILYTLAVEQLFKDELPQLKCLLLYLNNNRNRLKKLLINMLSIRDQWWPLLMNSKLLELLAKTLEHLKSDILNSIEKNIPNQFNSYLIVDKLPQDYNAWLRIANILLTKNGLWRKKLTFLEGFQPLSYKEYKNKTNLNLHKNIALKMITKLYNEEEFRKQLYSIKILSNAKYSDKQCKLVYSLVNILKLLSTKLIKVFKDTGQVDHIEVLLAASRGLTYRNNTSTQAFKNKISHILVDEFQDTSISQFHLLENLVENWENNHGKTLFLVGDPMQSIYKFRQAEIGLFIKAKEQGVGKMKLNFAQLKMNFRSNKSIVEWINNFFYIHFPYKNNLQLGAISYTTSIAYNANYKNSAVQCINTNDDIKKIVEIIQNNHNKSIAILVRARSHLSGILSTLREKKIAYQGTDLEKLVERPIVQDLCALTKALLHLDDRIAWLSVLRAPWLGLNLAELELLTEFDGTIWEAIQESCNRIEPFCTIITDAIAQSGRIPIDQLIKKTWKNLGGEACLRDSNERYEADTYFKFLTKYAHNRKIYEPNFIETHLDKIYMHPQHIDQTAVQIMTIHKAKGLEFDIVIIPKLERQIKNTDQKLLLLDHCIYKKDHLLAVPIKINKFDDNEYNRLYDYLSWCEKERQIYENIRLFYVAITRAKEKIYCLANFNESKPHYNSFLAYFWSSIKDKFNTKFINIRQLNDVTTNIKLRRLPQKWHEINPYSNQNYPTINYKTQLLKIDGEQLLTTVMHRILYHITKYGSKNMPNWIKCAKNLGLEKKYIYFIGNFIKNIITCRYANKILDRHYKDAYSEWNITVMNNNKFEQLIIDRAYLAKNNVFWIINYKIALSYDEDQLKKSIAQINRYVEAVKHIKVKHSIAAGIYFPIQQKFYRTYGNEEIL